MQTLKNKKLKHVIFKLVFDWSFLCYLPRSDVADKCANRVNGTKSTLFHLNHCRLLATGSAKLAS